MEATALGGAPMSRSRTVLLCIVTLSSFPFRCSARSSDASDTRGSLCGKVLLAQDGRPAWHVRVEVWPAAAKQSISRYTNRKGEFKFANLAFGTYIVTANAMDYTPAEQTVELGSAASPLLLQLQKSENAYVVSVHESSVPEKALRDFNEGIRRLAAQDLAGSIRAFERAIKKFPDYYEAYDKVGVAEVELQRDAEAELAFRKSIELSGGKYAEPHFALGVILCDTRKRYAEAESVILEGLEVDPGSVVGHFALGWVLYTTNRLAEAENSAREALQHAPDSPVIRVLLAEIHLRQRNEPALLEDVDAYLRLEPDGPFSAKARAVQADARSLLSQQRGVTVTAVTQSNP